MKKRFGALLFVALCGFGECQNEDAFSLLASGYVLISPPTNLTAPGAVVLMVRDAQGRAQLRTLCGPRSSLSEFFSPRVSETLSATYKLSRSQKMTLEADAVDKFRARAQAEDVATVQVVLSRPRVVEADEADIYAHIDSRSEDCQRAIDSRIEAGFAPTFITSAYIADVQYTVSFKHDRQLTKRVREERMARIAANLGGGHTEITEHTLRAQNLALAAKFDSFPLTIRPSGAAPPTTTPVLQDGSPKEGVVEAIPGSEVPLRPPAGGWVNPVIGG